MKRDIHNKDNEVVTSNLEPNIMDLTFVVKTLAMLGTLQVMMFGICATMGHPIDCAPFFKKMQKMYMPWENFKTTKTSRLVIKMHTTQIGNLIPK